MAKKSAKAAKVGRPKGETGTARKGYLFVRLSEDEQDELKAFAEGRGYPLATWARAELLRLAREGQ